MNDHSSSPSDSLATVVVGAVGCAPAEAEGAPPTSSRVEGGAFACGADDCGAAENGDDALDPPETREANGSTGAGEARCCCCCCCAGAGVADCDTGWDSELRTSIFPEVAVVGGAGLGVAVVGVSNYFVSDGLPLEDDLNIPNPRLTGPGAGRSWKDKPRRSSSREVLPGAAVLPSVAPPLELGSGSKSIRENSLLAFFDTPVVVPSVPLGMLAAPSKSPFLTSLYRSIVLLMLSLITLSFSTASVSSDSSSIIF